MRCALVVFGLLVLIASVVCEQSGPEVVKSWSVNGKENSKLLLALVPSSGINENREKRSPTKKGYGYGGHHGGGGGGCNICNQGGGYYPSGGYSSGGSFSHAQASASSSSFSGGHYG